MTVVDLTGSAAATGGLLDALPRRAALTLPELVVAAELAGDAPLPFRPEPHGAGASPLEDRLGRSRAAGDDDAFLSAVARLRDPRESLARRGLLAEDVLDPGLAGALGLLADPTLALDLDLAVEAPGCTVQAKAWHRERAGAVATMSTVDGVVFEMAWFDVQAWSTELSRVGVLPAEVEQRPSAVPRLLDAPYELLDAVGQALRDDRADLVPLLVAKHAESILADDRPLTPAEAGSLLEAVHRESSGRLRALATRVTEDGTAPVGVASWLLLADGWHALRPHTRAGEARVAVQRVTPDELATDLAPVLAEVVAGAATVVPA